jgi:hypothetical protein
MNQPSLEAVQGHAQTRRYSREAKEVNRTIVKNERFASPALVA